MKWEVNEVGMVKTEERRGEWDVPAPGGPMSTILGAPATAPVAPTADLAESIALETAFPVLFSS